MALYSADEIIGKSLIAKVPIPIRRDAKDNAPIVYTVPAGQNVGTVYSWLNVDANRSRLYWAFYDQYKRPYYAPHQQGYYDISSLQQQGAMTVKEQVEAEKAKTETTGDIIQKNFKLLLFVGAAVIIAKSVLPELIKRK